MSKIAELFRAKRDATKRPTNRAVSVADKVLNVYCTAGYPKLDSTREVMRALQDNGADLIELGMPYSDPLADGETIQQSGSVALQNGMTIQVLFDQLQDCRKEIHIPVVLMGYMNPILQYGFTDFCQKAAEVGIDALILPDLPPHEFEAEYGAIIHHYGLDFVFLVTPETAPDRVQKLDQLSPGFLYAVSSSSTTGHRQDFPAVEKYLERLQNNQLKNPVLVGFGIKDHESFLSASKHAAGAIIGSAYIKAIDQGGQDIAGDTAAFMRSVLQPA